MLNRFNRLIGDLIKGTLSRNTFQPWEIDILVDLDTCPIPEKRRTDVLRQYQRAVNRQFQTSPNLPMTLSQFLQSGKPGQSMQTGSHGGPETDNGKS